MAKGYIIEETAIAKEEHPTRAGEKHVWHFGTNEKFWRVKDGEEWWDDYKSKESCYKQRWQAEKQMQKYQEETNEPYWDFFYRVVEIEC